MWQPAGRTGGACPEKRLIGAGLAGCGDSKLLTGWLGNLASGDHYSQ